MATFKSEDFREAVRNILQDYQKEYHSIAQPVVEKIIQDIQNGKPLVKTVSEALSETSFFDANKEATLNAIYLASCAGYGVLPKLVVNSERIKNTLLSDAWTGDDMPLSRRLHGATPLMRESIVTTIRKSMLAAQTVKDMAMNLYDGYNSGKTVIHQAELPQYLQKIETYARWAADGDMQLAQTVLALTGYIKKKINMGKTPNLRTAYSELVDACKTFSVEAINKAVHTALEEKSRYHAERIARTESARAWFDGFVAKNQDDSDVWGYRWVLSSRHALVPFDQCDVCANMNVGFGKGVYPKNKVPSIPRHPNCMCMLQVIYVWEVKADQEFQPKKAREYIDALPEGKQQQLFGKAGVEAFKSGGDWEKILRGWDGFYKPKSRLNQADFQLQMFNENGKIKEMDIAEKIRKSIIENGPKWKEDKLKVHLEKRKRLGHIPADWTAENYNEKIIDIVSDKRVEIYKYYLDGFSQNYYVYGLPKWIVIVGEDGIVETSFPVDRMAYNEYLNPKSGYHRIK